MKVPTRFAFFLLAVPLCLAALLALAPNVRADEADDLWLKARATMAAGRWDEARETLLLLLDRYPDHPLAETFRLALARAEPDGPSAEEMLRRVAAGSEGAPETAEARVRLAQALLLTGETAETSELLLPVVDGTYAPRWKRAAHLLLGEAATLERRDKDAEASFLAVLSEEPTGEEAVRARLALAALARERGDDAEAERLLALCRAEGSEDLEPSVLWQTARSGRGEGDAEGLRSTLTLLAGRFPDSPEGVAAREELRSLGDETDQGAAGGEEGLAAAEPSGSEAGADSTAAESSALEGQEEEAHYVRTGRFSSWGDADALRARLAAQTEVRLHVVPAPDDGPPYAVESEPFNYLSEALRFSMWMEDQGGFVSWLVTREEGGGTGHVLPPDGTSDEGE